MNQTHKLTKEQYISIDVLLKDFAQLERQGVRYGYGRKAEHAAHALLRDAEADLRSISAIDCSGVVRLELFRASDGNLLLPDGSQQQRGWAEANLREVSYKDAARYITEGRAFLCFIKPNENGCGRVGHVWLLLNADLDADAETLESCGGRGVTSRPWNTRVLLREVFSCFELPCLPRLGVRA